MPRHLTGPERVARQPLGALPSATGLVELRSEPCGLGHSATIPSAARSATVEFDKTWLDRPTDWALRIFGQSIGGYGFIDHRERRLPTARYAERELAERAAAIWVETGLTPAYQTDERIAEVRALAKQELAA